jgi:signal peptidase
MEITTSPSRPAPTPWGRLLLLVVVVAPVSILVLLPTGLGLQRYVVSGSSMAGDRPGSIARGSLVLERLVPVDDLRPGDVITFRAPGPGGRGPVTHRVVSVGLDGIRTQGDADPEPDPWLLRPARPVVPRVVWTVPGVGYAYLALGDWRFWVGVGVLMTIGVVTASGVVRRRGRATAARSAPPDPVAGPGRPPDPAPVPAGAGAGSPDGSIGAD